jgi:hypothetical protein
VSWHNLSDMDLQLARSRRRATTRRKLPPKRRPGAWRSVRAVVLALVATNTDSGTPVVADALAKALRKGRGTGQVALTVGAAVTRRAGGFALELSSLVDSATNVSSTIRGVAHEPGRPLGSGGQPACCS